MSIKIVVSRKTVSISEETHSELTKIGVYGETIDDIIKKCVEAYKRERKIKTNLDNDEPSFGQTPAGPPPKRK